MMRPARRWGLVLLVVTGCRDATAPERILDLAAEWGSAAPADVGLDADQLALAAAYAAGEPQIRSLLVARHGRIALEQYYGGSGPATPFDVRSVTKSIVATLTGIAVAEGTLRLETSQADWLDGFILDAHDRAVTVRHLLSARTWSWCSPATGRARRAARPARSSAPAWTSS